MSFPDLVYSINTLVCDSVLDKICYKNLKILQSTSIYNIFELLPITARINHVPSKVLLQRSVKNY